MNNIHVLCPYCRDYGILTKKIAGYVMTCCGSWLLNASGDMVISQQDLIKTLKSGSWKVSVFDTNRNVVSMPVTFQTLEELKPSKTF